MNVPIYIHPTLAWQTPRNYQDHRELGAAIWGWAPETTGTLSSPEDTVLIPLNLLTGGMVTLQTFGFGGGTNAAGTVVPAGGFDPFVGLFYGTGPTALFLNGCGYCRGGAAEEQSRLSAR